MHSRGLKQATLRSKIGALATRPHAPFPSSKLPQQGSSDEGSQCMKNWYNFSYIVTPHPIAKLKKIIPVIIKYSASIELSICSVFFISGHDTTTSAISFIMYSLAEHQDIQERCRAEVDTILEGRDNDYIEW